MKGFAGKGFAGAFAFMLLSLAAVAMANEPAPPSTPRLMAEALARVIRATPLIENGDPAAPTYCVGALLPAEPGKDVQTALDLPLDLTGLNDKSRTRFVPVSACHMDSLRHARFRGRPAGFAYCEAFLDPDARQFQCGLARDHLRLHGLVATTGSGDRWSLEESRPVAGAVLAPGRWEDWPVPPAAPTLDQVPLDPLERRALDAAFIRFVRAVGEDGPQICLAVRFRDGRPATGPSLDALRGLGITRKGLLPTTACEPIWDHWYATQDGRPAILLQFDQVERVGGEVRFALIIAGDGPDGPTPYAFRESDGRLSRGSASGN